MPFCDKTRRQTSISISPVATSTPPSRQSLSRISLSAKKKGKGGGNNEGAQPRERKEKDDVIEVRSVHWKQNDGYPESIASFDGSITDDVTGTSRPVLEGQGEKDRRDQTKASSLSDSTSDSNATYPTCILLRYRYGLGTCAAIDRSSRKASYCYMFTRSGN